MTDDMLQDPGQNLVEAERIDRFVEVYDTAQVQESHGLQKASADGPFAVSWTDERLRSSSAEVGADGVIVHSLRGKAPRGEEGTLEVCQILVRHLNRGGANWSDPCDVSSGQSSRGDDVDCEAYDGTRRLRIQATRISYGDADYQILGSGRESVGVNDPGTLAERIKLAIDKKSICLPEVQQRDLTLALDVTDTAGLALPSVVQEFSRQFRREIQREWLFQSIWLISRFPDLIIRLDNGMDTDPRVKEHDISVS